MMPTCRVSPPAAPHRFDSAARIARERLVAIVRSDDASTARRVARAVITDGTGVLEISVTTPGAIDVIEALCRDEPQALIGAGTILDVPTARLALLAGARFLVSPGLSPPVIGMGQRYGAAVVTGVQTATEVETALSAGADLLKLFPAATVGPNHLAALRAPLPQAPFLATGGIAPEDAPAWLQAGAVALGVGVGTGTTAEPRLAVERLRAFRRATAG